MFSNNYSQQTCSQALNRQQYEYISPIRIGKSITGVKLIQHVPSLRGNDLSYEYEAFVVTKQDRGNIGAYLGAHHQMLSKDNKLIQMRTKLLQDTLKSIDFEYEFINNETNMFILDADILMNVIHLSISKAMAEFKSMHPHIK